MSIKSQKKSMKEIATLLSQDLGYIFGELESGPNGAKKQFLTKSAAFLRALGKDLGFIEMKVTTNPGGIAVSGEVMLYGMWSDDNGITFILSQLCGSQIGLMYRTISHIKDYQGGPNQWLRLEIFKNQDYEQLCEILLKHKKADECPASSIVA